MEQFLSVLTKYRNVCAHGERLFTYRTVDAIADTPLHKKLSLPQSGNQYEKGKHYDSNVTVHFVHSNVAKIHSRLPTAMEFWLV